MELTESFANTSPAQPLGIMLACMKFFGKHPNQSTPEFAAEVKALTATDVADLKTMFTTMGWSIRD